jgi:sulfoxide reductase catalytic subunit YedY
MLIKTYKDIPSHEITSPEVFYARRRFIKTGLATVGLSILSPRLKAEETLEKTPIDHIKNYTNYYEFSYNKEDSTTLAQRLVTQPWLVEISGEVEKTGIYYL